MMRSSDELDKLAPALVAFEAEARNPVASQKADIQTKSGGKISYTYADFPTIVEELRPLLAKHGLVILQGPTAPAKGGVGLTTRLLHVSGQWIESSFDMPVESSGPQAVGAAISYARRYAETAMLNLAADEDDDGKAAMPAKKQAAKKQAEQRDNQRPAAAPAAPSQPAASPAETDADGWFVSAGWTGKAEHDAAIQAQKDAIAKGEAAVPGFRDRAAALWRERHMSTPMGKALYDTWRQVLELEYVTFARSAAEAPNQ